MAKGIKIARVLGIQISIDYTWFLVFVLFAWSLSYGYFPFRTPGLPRGEYLLMGVVSALLLFVCVLVHEISHSYVSNRLGLNIREITLFIFGGVAQLTKEPEDAMTELKIAAAGPAASLVLAIMFRAAAGFVDRLAHPEFYAVLSYLALINMVLLIFNMIPGFPLDGGRIFRAIWWARTGDLNRATRVASSIGKGFAFFLIILGFFEVFMGNFVGGLWSVLIGFFVQQAAESGYQQVLMKRALEGIKVKDLMSKGVISVGEDAPLSKVIDEYFFKYHFVSFPVTSNSHVVGLLTMGNARSVERDKWEQVHVKDVMNRLEPKDVLSPDDSALDALSKMMSNGAGRYPVIDERGALVGIISRRDIMKMLEFRAGMQG